MSIVQTPETVAAFIGAPSRNGWVPPHMLEELGAHSPPPWPGLRKVAAEAIARSDRHAFVFKSRVEIEDQPSVPDFDQATIKAEPMFHKASPEFANRHGGPITRAFLAALPAEPDVIDTRVHMLMKDFYPCIPGWHHDDIARTRADGQPNYREPPYKSHHLLMLINGEIAPTEFAVGDCVLSEVLEGEGNCYGKWHPEIERLIARGQMQRVAAPSRRLVRFDHDSFHQGVACTRPGWRWFARATYGTQRKPDDEIRSQVQVYLADPMQGW